MRKIFDEAFFHHFLSQKIKKQLQFMDIDLFWEIPTSKIKVLMHVRSSEK